MKKLSDDHFDELLRQKTESFDYDFDEAAWDKMEQKLRKRDRVVFIRNSSFVLLLFLLTAGAFLLIENKNGNETNKIAKEPKVIKGDKSSVSGIHADKIDSAQLVKAGLQIASSQSVEKTESLLTEFKKVRQKRSSETFVEKEADQALIHNQTPTAASDRYSTLDLAESSSVILPETSSSIMESDIYQNNVQQDINDTTTLREEENKPLRKRKQLAFSVTALAGPEFSSIKSIAGNKGTATVGLLLNASFSNKIMLSSGLKYGLKNYQATGYNYELQNPARAGQISGIDASCNILEIPLQVSYALLNNSKKRIAVSSGLSSYLMLKEEYNFRYTPQSGRKDYLLVKNNANQHYFSVLSLSASYHIKPKSSSIQWAIEPYIKLPLGGVGEGNVKLKSSGVSLNLTYDISKKIK